MQQSSGTIKGGEGKMTCCLHQASGTNSAGAPDMKGPDFSWLSARLPDRHNTGERSSSDECDGGSCLDGGLGYKAA